SRERTLRARISAIVLTKNEADNIAECLTSLAWADEQIVLDSFSDDDTVTLAQEAGARVYQRRFRDYADQRNAALDLITTDWVFFVDADERATPDLAEEIRRVTAHRAKAGWWAPRHNYIFGHRMRGAGWYPDYQLRLFQRDLGWYNPNRQVHEVVILDGPAGHLENPLIHYNYNNLREFRERQAKYTDYDAAMMYAAGRRARPHNFILQPLREFRRRFWSEAGYRDRFYGLLLSSLMAYYEYVKYRKLWRSQRHDPAPSASNQ
ncbi:MAG: glycosyltransferase family 2 protein, partial [Anaerolineae bacterium]